jgi:PST family polysaccharide transporter
VGLPFRKLSSAVRHPLSQNAAAMYAAQLALTLLPLVTLPWLARALGPAGLGLAIFVQSMASLIGIVVGFGFYLSGTRDISRQRDDRKAMGQTVAGVVSGQLLLGGITGVAAAMAWVTVPEFRDDLRLPLFAWGMGVLQGLNPTWFLMGVERLRLQAFIEVTVRTLQAVAIVVFVRDVDDVILVLWIWLAGNAIVTGILAVLVYRAVPMRRPRLAAGVEAVRSGWSLFLTATSVSLLTSGTVFVLGLLVSSAQLAIFASAERIVRAALRASAPLGAVTFPRVSYFVSDGQETRAQRLAVLTLAARAGLALLSAALLILLAPLVVRILLGPDFEDSIGILRILALLIPIFAVSATLSQHWLLSHGRDSETLRIAIGGGVLTLLLTLAIGSTVGIVGVAWALVGVQAGVVAVLVHVIRRAEIAPRLAQLAQR